MNQDQKLEIMDNKDTKPSASLKEISIAVKGILDEFEKECKIFAKVRKQYQGDFVSEEVYLAEMIQSFGNYLMQLPDVEDIKSHQKKFDTYASILAITIDCDFCYFNSDEKAKKIMEDCDDHHPVHVITFFFQFIPNAEKYLKKLIYWNYGFIWLKSSSKIIPFWFIFSSSMNFCMMSTFFSENLFKDTYTPIQLAVMMGNLKLISLFDQYCDLGEDEDEDEIFVSDFYGSIELAFSLARLNCIDYLLTKSWDRLQVVNCITIVFILMNEQDSEISIEKNKIIFELIEKLKLLKMIDDEDVIIDYIRPFLSVEKTFFASEKYAKHQLSLSLLCKQFKSSQASLFDEIQKCYTLSILTILFETKSQEDIINFININKIKMEPAYLKAILVNCSQFYNLPLLQKRIEEELTIQEIRENYFQLIPNLMGSNLEAKLLCITLDIVRKKCQLTLPKWLIRLSDIKCTENHSALSRILNLENYSEFFASEDIKPNKLLPNFFKLLDKIKQNFIIHRQDLLIFSKFVACLFLRLTHDQHEMVEKQQLMADLQNAMDKYFFILKDLIFDNWNGLDNIGEVEDKIILGLVLTFGKKLQFIEYGILNKKIFGFNLFSIDATLNESLLIKILSDESLQNIFLLCLDSLKKQISQYVNYLNEQNKLRQESKTLSNFIIFAQNSLWKTIEEVYQFHAKFPSKDQYEFAVRRAGELNRSLRELLYSIHHEGTHQVKVHKAAAESFEFLENKYAKEIKNESDILNTIVEFIRSESDKHDEKKDCYRKMPSIEFVTNLVKTESPTYLYLAKMVTLKANFSMSFLHGLCLLWLAVNDPSQYLTNFSELHGENKSTEAAKDMVRLTFFDYMVDLHLICNSGMFNKVTNWFALYITGIISSEITLENGKASIPVHAQAIAYKQLLEIKSSNISQFARLINLLLATEDLSLIWDMILPQVSNTIFEIYDDLNPQEKLKLKKSLEETKPEWIDFDLQKLLSLSKDLLSIEIDVPQDGNCLFWSAMLAFLLVVVNSSEFGLSYQLVFGDDKDSKKIEKMLSIYDLNNSTFIPLLLLFRQRVIKKVIELLKSDVNWLEEYKGATGYEDKMSVDGAWAGTRELLGIAHLLKTKVFCYVQGRVDKYGEEYRQSTPIHLVVTQIEGQGEHFKFKLPNETWQKIQTNRQALEQKTELLKSHPLALPSDHCQQRSFFFNESYFASDKSQKSQQAYFFHINKYMFEKLMFDYLFVFQELRVHQVSDPDFGFPYDLTGEQRFSFFIEMLKMIKVRFHHIKLHHKNRDDGYDVNVSRSSFLLLRNFPLLHSLEKIKYNININNFFLSSKIESLLMRFQKLKEVILNNANLDDQKTLNTVIGIIESIDPPYKQTLLNICMRINGKSVVIFMDKEPPVVRHMNFI